MKTFFWKLQFFNNEAYLEAQLSLRPILAKLKTIRIQVNLNQSVFLDSSIVLKIWV